MGELFFALALALIVGAYAGIALMLLLNEAGPWISARMAKRARSHGETRKASVSRGKGAHRPDTTIERPTFHPNL